MILKAFIQRPSLRRTVLMIIALFFLDHALLEAQSRDNWRSITSFNSVADLAIDSEGAAWGVSEGGLFSFQDGEYISFFSTVEGMHRLNASAVTTLPASQQIVIGYTDGMIDLYSSERGEFEKIEDIFRADAFPSKIIHRFWADLNDLFVAVDFGVVVYNTNTFLVRESFTKIGTFDRGIPVRDLQVMENTLLVATDQGVAIGNRQQNLSGTEAWQNFGSDEGLTGSIQAVIQFEEVMFASNEDQNFEFDGNQWNSTTRFGTAPVRRYVIHPTTNQLIALTDTRLFIMDEDGNTTSRPLPTLRANAIAPPANDSELLFIGSLTEGMGQGALNGQEITFFPPPGPNINFFEGMSFDGDVFISGTSRASARDAQIDNGKGYFIERGDVWSNFNRQNTPALAQNIYRQAFRTAVTDEYYYIGSWGRGVARHTKETDEIFVFNSSNSTLEGFVADDPNFPVISGLEVDSEGVVWAVSRFGNTPLYAQRPGDDDWINHPKAPSTAIGDEYQELLVDSFDQKWVSLLAAGGGGRGLLVIDSGELEDVSDQRSVKLTDNFNNGNLPNNRVNAFLEDKNGEIWIGTERGIARFIFPQFVIDGNVNERRSQWLINDDPDADSPFLLRDINVTAMAVNSANQKWIGTASEGVWLLNEQGGTILQHFTSENSPLMSNSIVDLAVRESTGEVYIATDQGLIIFEDVPLQSVASMRDLKVYPNPFLYDQHQEIVIEGLSDQTTVRILAIDGLLIRSFDVRGGRAVWDGFDFSGRRVGSGVYIVVAVAEDGSDRGTGKVVIIR
ncbi:MAG: two-component regulator propeller domain-containing protein [Balneolaceae bacterium]